MPLIKSSWAVWLSIYSVLLTHSNESVMGHNYERVRGSWGWRITSTNKRLCLIHLLFLQFDVNTSRVYKMQEVAENGDTAFYIARWWGILKALCWRGKLSLFLLSRCIWWEQHPSITIWKCEMKIKGYRSKWSQNHETFPLACKAAFNVT